MLLHDPDGFDIQEPTAKKVPRTALSTPGLHYEWSGDGHDKLSAIGFPIWGVKEKWCTKWLGLWVVPNNRLKQTIAYLYLSLIEEVGGVYPSSQTYSFTLLTPCRNADSNDYGLRLRDH